MVSCRQNAGTYEICHRDQVVFSFQKHTPFLWIGHGKTSFSMHRGSFQIQNTVQEKVPLTVQKIQKNKDDITISFSAQASTIALTLTLTCLDNQLQLRFCTPEMTESRIWLRLPSAASEHVYGCGENFTRFDLKGELVQIWVQEHYNLGKFIKKAAKEIILGKNPKRMTPYRKQQTYYVQPTFLSSKKYFLHVDSDQYMAFNFQHADYHELALQGLPDITIGFGDSFELLAENLSGLLGRQPVLPDWVYDGAILGIQGGTQAVEDKLARVAQAGMPVTGVWCQDWQGARVTAVGKQLMWNWVWDRDRYPGLDDKLAAWKQKGVHFLGYINPFLAVEKELYQYASKMGYCVKDKNGNDYMVLSTTFDSAMVDFTNPDAYRWIKTVIQENMIDFGLDGWMADYGEYLPTDCVLHSGIDPAVIHNAWPAIWAKINREAVEERGKLGEVFFFTRAGHTGTVAHSTMMWNGDQFTDWSLDGGMPSVIPATLSLSACGFGLVHSDIGGFTSYLHVKRSPELLMRWAEMNAFTPLFRSHESIRPDNNIQFDADDTVLSHYARMSRVHAALKPYLLALDQQNHTRGIPVMRPLFYYYANARDFTECYEYLLGRDILVAPVLEKGAKDRTVYLPQDHWVHLWSGTEYAGGNHRVAAPLGKPPVFCRMESPFLQDFLALDVK